MQSTARNKSQKLSQSDWQRYSKEWESSTESQAAFCKRHQLSYYTFGYWRSKFIKQKEAQKPPHFSAVKIKTSTIQKKISPITLSLPNGVTLSIPPQADKQSLKQLFELLEVVSC